MQQPANDLSCEDQGLTKSMITTTMAQAGELEQGKLGEARVVGTVGTACQTFCDARAAMRITGHRWGMHSEECIGIRGGDRTAAVVVHRREEHAGW
jgi:hypothetical protein